MSNSGHWLKLAYYSLALRQEDDSAGKLAARQRARPALRPVARCEKKRIGVSACLAALLACSAAPAQAADEPARAEETADECVELFGLMYWTHRDEGIYRACRDGSHVKLLLPMKNVDGLAVDEAGGMLYFTVSAYPELHGDKLMQARLDGAGVKELAQGLNFTGDLAFDAKQRKLYISSVGDGKIMQCNLDGSERKDWLTGLGSCDELALDAENRKLYWAGNGKIQRASLDNVQIEDVAATNTRMMGLALELANKRLYYATLQDGTIRRIGLDGADDQAVVSGHPGVDGVAFDPYSRKLYWTEEGKICQANEDGSEIETLVSDKTHRFASIVILQPKETR